MANSTASVWKKPYKNFPLSLHKASGRLCKVFAGRRIYFGYGTDWKAAIEEYESHLENGNPGQPDGLSLADLLNAFETHCEAKVACGEMANRTYSDYRRVADRIARVLDKKQKVAELGPEQFARLRADISRTFGVVATSNEIGRVRVIFNFAFKNLLIESPVKYGLSFDRPTKKALRQARAARPKKLFSAIECRRIIKAALPKLKAQILLGLNCAYGNSDIGRLPIAALDLSGGWVDFPRPKTGIERRCPLWAETVTALRVVLDQRASNSKLVFLTAGGNTYETSPNTISQKFGDLLDELDLRQTGRGFYSLRHTFRTVADGTRDFPACREIMGHSDSSMDAAYCEQISDERILAVSDHVHDWLFR